MTVENVTIRPQQQTLAVRPKPAYQTTVRGRVGQTIIVRSDPEPQTETYFITVSDVVQVVEVGKQGPPGAPGPRGLTGTVETAFLTIDGGLI